MPVEAKNQTDIKGSRKRAYVTVRHRLRGKCAVYQFLNELAGANRYLWNSTLGNISKDYEETGKTKTSYHDLCTWYKYHKHTEAQGLSKYPVVLTRTGLKDLSNAFKQFFSGTRNSSNFKSKKKTKKSFAFDVSGASLFKENGYVRLKRGLYAKLMEYDRINEYSNPVPKSARIFEEHGNWYITVQYEVDAIERETDERGIGVDRNVGQVADTNGTIHYLTRVTRRVARITVLQRRLAKQKKGSHRCRKTKETISRHERKLAYLRKNDLRHIAKLITSSSTLVFLEDLKTKGMARSAKGTIEQPGKNVKAKSGLNREILKTGWGQMERFLSERGYVHKVNPAYTSQTCSQCGYKDKQNRKTQSEIICLECGFKLNADTNAAMNIWAFGMASINGRGVYVRPVRRQQTLKRQNEYSTLGYCRI